MSKILTVWAIFCGHGRRRRGRRGVPELLADPSLQLGAVVVVPAARIPVCKFSSRVGKITRFVILDQDQVDSF